MPILICPVCGGERKRRYGKDSRHYFCQVCRNKRKRKQLRAKEHVRAAVRDGRLKKEVCEVCGEKESQGHHPDYEKQLEVRWLCQKHHMEAHALSRQ
jgi:hypothetical protein